jgi:GNAT superfamily N-acetyltransferase
MGIQGRWSLPVRSGVIHSETVISVTQPKARTTWLADGEPKGDAISYPNELEHDVVTLDSAPAHLRPIRPDDGDRLRAFHARLSPYSVYLRFLSPHEQLSDEEVRYFTCLDYHDRLALVVESGGELRAIGRFDRLSGSKAEVAFVVADEFQQRGLGTLLLAALARAARTRGIDTFVAETLAENHRMLDVFRRSGYDVQTRCHNGTLLVELSLTSPETPHRGVRRTKCKGSEDGTAS